MVVAAALQQAVVVQGSAQPSALPGGSRGFLQPPPLSGWPAASA